MGHLDIKACENCGAGLLSVSDICPQCGWLKNNSIKHESDIVENETSEPTAKPTKINNAVFRPSGVKLLGIFSMLFGVSLIVFAMIFGSAVMLILMSSGMDALSEIGGGGPVDISSMLMLPTMTSLDPSTMSSLETIIELNEITGSISANEIEQRMSSTSTLNFDALMEIMTETSVFASIEIALGVFVFFMGRGLFKGARWARLVTIMFAIISIPLAISFLENLDNLALLGMIAFNGMVIYYLFKSKVREYFNQNLIRKSTITESTNQPKS